MKDFARRLLGLEVSADAHADSDDFAGFRVCGKLEIPLSKLMGSGGYRAFLARSLSLAGAEFPWLGKLFIREDSSLEGLSTLKEELDADVFAVAEVALVAHLLGLLVTFIGPGLTLQLIREAWPKGDFADLTFETTERP